MATLAECFKKSKVPDDIQKEILAYGNDQEAVGNYLQDMREAMVEVAESIGVDSDTSIKRNADIEVAFIGEEKLGNTIESRQKYYESKGVIYEGDNAPLGIIDIVDDTYLITLFKKKTLATLLHETGHLFLEELRTIVKSGLGSQQALDDWEILADYLGIEAGTTAILYRQHELFARSFEAYVREGNAPSIELEPAFSRFRKWLTRIYTTVSKLYLSGVYEGITPEVRGVMDRMLATEEQIEQLEMVNGMRASLGRVADVPEIGEERKSRLQKLVDDGAQEMADKLWKSRTRREAQLITQWRSDIKEDMDGERAYIAWNDIKKHGGLNPVRVLSEFSPSVVKQLRAKGLIAPQIGKNVPKQDSVTEDIDVSFDTFGFDMDEMRDEVLPPSSLRSRRGIPYAPGDVHTIMNAIDDLGGIKTNTGTPEYDDKPTMKGMFARITTSTGGFSPDQMAALLETQFIGDGTVNNMWAEVQKDIDVRASIKEKGEKLGSASGPGFGLSPEVVAVRSGYGDGLELIFDLLMTRRPSIESQERVNQMRELSDSQVSTPEALLDSPQILKAIDSLGQYYAESLRGGATAIKKQVIKNIASEAFWKLPVRDALRVDRFMGNVQRHLNAERKAVAQNDFNTAMSENTKARQQIEMAKLARTFRSSKEKTLRKIHDMARTKPGKIEENHHKNLLALIDRFKLSTIPARIKIDYADKVTLNDLLMGQIDDLGLMSVAEQYSDHIRSETFSGDYRGIIATDFDEIINLVDLLNGRGRGIVNNWVKHAGMTADEAREKLIEESSSKPTQKRKTINSLFGKSAKLLRDLRSDLRMMPFTFRHMGGTAPGQRGDSFHDNLVLRPLNEAQRNNELLMRSMRGKMQEAMVVFEAWGRKAGAYPQTTVGVPKIYADEYGVNWTSSQIMSVALNMGNTHNMHSVAAGMGYVDDKGDINTQPLYDLVKGLGKKEWQTVQEVWDLVDSMWPAIAKQHRDMYYYTPNKVEAEEFNIVTNDGDNVTLKGGYYPLKFDGQLDDVTKGREEVYDLMNSSAAVAPMVKKGFTKARQGVSGKPVLLSLGVLPQHIEYAGKLITHGKVIQDVYRIFGVNDDPYRKEFKRVWGKEQNEHIENWLKAQMGSETDKLGPFDRAINKMRPYVTSFYLFGSPKTSMLQVAAVGDLVAEIGSLNYKNGLSSLAAKMMRSPTETIKWIDELSPFMEGRRTSREREVMETLKQMDMNFRPNAKLGSNHIIDKLGRGLAKGQLASTQFAAFMLAAPAWAVEVPAWIAVYENEMVINGGDTPKAAAEADARIARSQPSQRPMDMAAMQRNRRGMHILFTFFTSFGFAFGNRNGAAWNSMQAGDMSKLEFAKYWGMQAVLTPALTTVAFAAWWLKDPSDEEEMGKLGVNALAEVFTYQFQGIPVVSQVIRGMTNKALGKFSGDPFGSPLLSVGDLMIRSMNNILELPFKLGDAKTQDDALWSLYELASVVTKIPASRIHARLDEGIRQVNEEDAWWPNLLLPDPDLRK